MAFEKEQPGLDLKILFENEAQIRAFPDDVPYIFFRNNNDGKYLDAKIKDESQLTEKGCSLYHSGKLIGSKIEDIHESDNAKIIMDGIRIALETGGRQVIQYSYEPEEQKRFFESKLLPIGADEVVSIVREVTEQKIIEDALRYQFEKNQDYPISSAPWWAEQIKNSEYVQVGDVDALPDEIEPAFKINLSAEQLADSVLLAQVHDLGKVGVPDQYF